MSAAEKFLKRFEANISQSLGVRDDVQPQPQARPGTELAGPGDGRLRARSLGHMDIRNVVPDPGQPRKEFDEDALERLSRSVAKFGQLLPIRVRWDEALRKWLIISGERRYRAALRAGLEQVTCHFVDEGLSPARILEEQVVENCLREDLKPVEQARAYRALMDTNGWSARKVAEELHVASSTVVKALALLRIPDDVQRLVDAGLIPATAAYELAKLDGEDAQREAAHRVSGGKMSREEAVRLVKEATGKKSGGPSKEPTAISCNPVRSSASRRLEYSLSSGITLTLSADGEVTAGDLVAAIEATLKDLRARIKRGEEIEILSPDQAPSL
jgi:ParB family transcriptional regulator, chromosome partitioning protein